MPSQSFPEPNYIKKRRDTERNQRESQHHEDNMHVIGALDRIRDELVSTEKQDQADDDKRASREILTIILLIFTVIFTGGADIIFYCTMRDARSAAAKAHQDNIAALSRADEANKTSRESFTSVQRAYIVTPDVARRDIPSDEWMAWRYEPIIINVGNTQTKNFTLAELGPGNLRQLSTVISVNPLHQNISASAKRDICLANKLGEPPDPSILFAFEIIKKFHMIVAPKQKANVPQTELQIMNITGAQYDKRTGAIITDIPNFYLAGIATYNDVFPNTDPHVTKYCFRSVGIQAGGKEGAAGPILSLCSHWNCADKECDDDRKRFDEEAAKIADQCK